MVDEMHEQQRRDAVGDREVREIERHLQRRLAAIERQCDGRPGDVAEDHDDRRREEEADDERELAEREGLRVATELDVDDEHLCGAEERHQHPPRNLAGRCHPLQRADHLDEEDDCGRQQHDGEQVNAVSPPDGSGRRRRTRGSGAAGLGGHARMLRDLELRGARRASPVANR